MMNAEVNGSFIFASLNYVNIAPSIFLPRLEMIARKIFNTTLQI